jgi:hypothetical protein
MLYYADWQALNAGRYGQLSSTLASRGKWQFWVLAFGAGYQASIAVTKLLSLTASFSLYELVLGLMCAALSFVFSFAAFRQHRALLAVLLRLQAESEKANAMVAS